MINFEEEIRKFQPSLEVEDAEEAIYKTETPDVIDVLTRILNESKKTVIQ